jgi:hypothetical protein
VSLTHESKKSRYGLCNDILENAKKTTPVNIMKDDHNEGNEEEPLNQNGV